ncbi:TetR/AcrR family transcriptional regulator [Nakamurella sp. GG22]
MPATESPREDVQAEAAPARGSSRNGAPRTSGDVDPGRMLALLWGPRDRPGRSGLTVASIVESAIRLADADGLDALSMRGIAGDLGVGTMSLYTHVPGKPALIELMVDTVAGQVYAGSDEPSGRPGEWRSALAFIARHNWDGYLRHPWLLAVPAGRPVLGPNISRKYEVELRPLDGIGLSDIEMDSVLTLLLVHAEGMARWQVSLDQARRQSGESDLDWWTTISPTLATLMDSSAFPLGSRVGTAAGEYHQSSGDPAHIMEFGLERILDGVQNLIARHTGGPAAMAP